MIKIKTEENKICIEGHTLPDVCAAVSSVSTTIINCLIELCDEDDFNYSMESGDCTIEILKQTPITTGLQNVLITELTDISEDYKDCVTFV